MKNRVVKFICLFLAAVMCITVLPVSAFGENLWDDNVESLSATQKSEIESFYSWWQQNFVTNNTKISSKTGEERQYFIFKTIYDFAVDNIIYDYDVRDNKFPEDSLRFKSSHNIYGALFTDKSWSDYEKDVITDSNGLTRIKNTNQGLAVCEGFTNLVEYLCERNGLACKTIIGDYDFSAGKSEYHAWNVVELGGKWYYLDATTGKTSSSTIFELRLDGEQINFIDYGYFLRGTDNKLYSIKNHQMPDPHQQEAQTDDYIYTFEPIDAENTWKIVTRRLSTASEKEFENYCFVSPAPENKTYKVDTDNMTLIPSDAAMEYDGKDYCYRVKLQNFVDGIEFTANESSIKDAGNYVLAYVANGDKHLDFRVEPLDMGNLKNYETFTCNGEEISLSSFLTPKPFNGGSVEVSIEVYDKAHYHLIENVDYESSIIDSNGNKILHPYDVGEYKVVIDFEGYNPNYCGRIERSFKIVKGDISSLPIDNSSLQNIEYGSDIVKGASTTYIGNLTFYNGVDYTVSLADASKQNYGDSGYIVYTALASSKYFVEGTKLYRPYKIGRQCDLSSQFVGMSMGSYPYTGAQIKPMPKSLQAVINGKIVDLTNGVDYVISSYTNNVNVGTAYANIQFIGNFTGTAAIAFTIGPSSVSSGGASQTIVINDNAGTAPVIDVKTVESVKYTGKAITPPVTVTDNGRTLTAGKDYTVSALSGFKPGVYAYTVKGLGAYSSVISSSYALFIEPGSITGAKAENAGSAINLSWDNQGGMCSYEIYVYDTAKKKWSLLTTTSKSSYKVSKIISKGKKVSVKAGTKYKFRIKAKYTAEVNGAKYTKTSANKDFSAKLIKKSAALKSLKKGNKQLKATWSKYSGASGYTIELATDTNFKKDKKTVNVSKGGTTSATVKGLKAKKTYYVRIRAYETANGVKSYSPYSKTLKVKL